MKTEVSNGLKFAIVFMCFLLACSPCNAMRRAVYEQQRVILEKARADIAREEEFARVVQRRVLSEAQETIRRPAEVADSSFAEISKQIDELLHTKDASSEDIAEVSEKLEAIARRYGDQIDRGAYGSLKEKLGLLSSFSRTLSSVKNTYESTITTMDDAARASVPEQESVERWLSAASGGFFISVFANFSAVVAFMTKRSNTKLDRELKELLILEKKAELKKNGVTI